MNFCKHSVSFPPLAEGQSPLEKLDFKFLLQALVVSSRTKFIPNNNCRSSFSKDRKPFPVSSMRFFRQVCLVAEFFSLIPSKNSTLADKFQCHSFSGTLTSPIPYSLTFTPVFLAPLNFRLTRIASSFIRNLFPLRSTRLTRRIFSNFSLLV